MSLDYLARNNIPIVNEDFIMDANRCNPFLLDSGHVVYLNYELKLKKYVCDDQYDVNVNPCDNECCVLTLMQQSHYGHIKLREIQRKCCTVYVDIRNLNNMCCKRKETDEERLSLTEEFHAHGVIQIFKENGKGYYTISGNSDFLHIFVNVIYMFKEPEFDTEDRLQFEIGKRCKILIQNDFMRLCRYPLKRYFYFKCIMWSQTIRYIGDLNISLLLQQRAREQEERQNALR